MDVEQASSGRQMRPQLRGSRAVQLSTAIGCPEYSGRWQRSHKRSKCALVGLPCGRLNIGPLLNVLECGTFSSASAGDRHSPSPSRLAASTPDNYAPGFAAVTVPRPYCRTRGRSRFRRSLTWRSRSVGDSPRIRPDLCLPPNARLVVDDRALLAGRPSVVPTPSRQRNPAGSCGRCGGAAECATTARPPARSRRGQILPSACLQRALAQGEPRPRGRPFALSGEAAAYQPSRVPGRPSPQSDQRSGGGNELVSGLSFGLGDRGSVRFAWVTSALGSRRATNLRPASTSGVAVRTRAGRVGDFQGRWPPPPARRPAALHRRPRGLRGEHQPLHILHRALDGAPALPWRTHRNLTWPGTDGG
jgi:hypothetical protein